MRESKKARLQRLLRDMRIQRVDEAAWHELAARLAPISAGYLRTLLAGEGVAIDPPWCGVRQHTLEELAESLTALEREYAAGDAARKRLCRDMVIEAKARARKASEAGADADLRERKAEMVRWMLVWLENPGVFPVWAGLRRRAG